MLRLTFIPLLIVTLQLTAKHRAITLQTALNEKLVLVNTLSLGGHQGFCMNLSIKNLTKDSLVILLEAGRRLNSIDDQNQDILVVKEAIIALKSAELKHLKVKGYCCQASKHSPTKGAKYDVNVLGDSNFVKLARFLNRMEFEVKAEQEAVWAISEKRSAAHISSGNDSITRTLREMVAHIKGEELPWYRILSKEYVYQNGVIANVHLRLQGIISLSNDKENYITLSVRDTNGVFVCEIKKEWLKAGVQQMYKVDLPIKGLVKGKYSIEINSVEKQLAKREFEI